MSQTPETPPDASPAQKYPLSRRIKFFLTYIVLKLVMAIVWWSCKVRIIGEENTRKVLDTDHAFIPCYWHQHHIFGAWYMRKLIRQGRKIGFLISPSRDGEIPAKLARQWGAEVIRGSTTRTGAQALRDMYNLVVKQGVSPVTTSDGPQGPIHTFKVGDLLLSQFTQAPLLPVSYAASRYWQFKSWDKFIMPKPFSRIVITIGEPTLVQKGLIVEDLEPLRVKLETDLNNLQTQASDALTTN